MPGTAATFDRCGNWLTGDHRGCRDGSHPRATRHAVHEVVRELVRERAGRHVALDYYSYGVGDCLSIHDDDPDEANARRMPWRQKLRRRLAVATYFHPEWAPNWGGELVMYERGDRARAASRSADADAVHRTAAGLARHLRRASISPRVPRRPVGRPQPATFRGRVVPHRALSLAGGRGPERCSTAAQARFHAGDLSESERLFAELLARSPRPRGCPQRPRGDRDRAR